MAFGEEHGISNRLSGHEKDKLRKKFGHNRLSGKELDSGRGTKSKALRKKFK